jgi:pilus retraction protein PilT
VFKQRGYVGMVLRRIPSEFLTFEQLGLPPVIRELILRPRGLLLVTGPTGSGKTTSLASMINWLNDNVDHHIITLEDPIEYEFPLIRQTQIREATGLTFAEGVRAILRQDPDIILVGEIRDSETAQMAIRAAMTGHLVLTTLHTRDALGVLPRLFDLGISPALLAGNLNGIVAQRLVRHASGRGRIPIAETIVIDERLDALIARNATRHEWQQVLHAQKFHTLREEAMALLQNGTATREALGEAIDMGDMKG